MASSYLLKLLYTTLEMKIIGHRGARALAPENTIEGIREALLYDVDEIEFDVQVTKDNIAILNHNASIKSKSENGKRYPITKYTYAELKKIKINLTTLADAITCIDRQIPTYIEVKSGVKVEPIISSIKQFLKRGWKTSDFLLGSKSQRTLLRLHQELPKIQKIVIEPISGLRAVKRARQVSTTRLSLNQKWFWPTLVKYLHNRGLEVYLYTVNEPKRVEKWQKRGVVGIITDTPDRFVERKHK